ncbi:MAG: hypothetical protein R2712_06610 [Vicinamibacterales bacterium]
MMRHAHLADLRTTATMMRLNDRRGAARAHTAPARAAGRDRRLRDLIAWSYQPEHTERGGAEATGIEYTLALARLVLDNFDNLQASWVTQGGKGGAVEHRLRRQRHGQRDDRGERRARGETA